MEPNSSQPLKLDLRDVLYFGGLITCAAGVVASVQGFGGSLQAAVGCGFIVLGTGLAFLGWR